MPYETRKIIGLALALVFFRTYSSPAQQEDTRVFYTLQAFTDVTGQATAFIDFQRLPLGSLGTDTYRYRGVVFKTDPSLEVSFDPVPASLAIEKHLGKSSTKMLISDTIPMTPKALSLEFPPGTTAVGCYLVSAAGEGGARVRVEVRLANGSRHAVEVAVSPEESTQGRGTERRRNQTGTNFIGFVSTSDVMSVAFSAAANNDGSLYNFGIDDIAWVSRK